MKELSSCAAVCSIQSAQSEQSYKYSNQQRFHYNVAAREIERYRRVYIEAIHKLKYQSNQETSINHGCGRRSIHDPRTNIYRVRGRHVLVRIDIDGVFE